MILLDTHPLIWWAQTQSSRLSDRARKAISAAEREKNLATSAISIWEVCLLVKAERLQLKAPIQQWLNALYVLPELQIVSVDAEIARSSVYLPEPFHKDPADRIIVATALTLGAPLVTSDKKIRDYKGVQTIW